ncbi:ribulose-bisphosphate carboxylase large subunit family protein [Bradyrhizobium australiense]|uniref:Ribulose 1,5-bisphosphate carboxylase n=1 Tax=Bradyrhizobium australiense TaxID=2721161 RepID=A0A7Y4LUB6_9BRAD|nr:RuBisCO large subunit C-terminal-like domain-containing protein [Bradyrhizobium australiense]NOJ39152.1 ribulose 1,5-bisphosphate carboxylase [Bradyrhizobium australiense]
MTAPVRIEADYLIETPCDPRATAEAIAGEQSSGTFVAVPGETAELKQRAAARVESIELLDQMSAPSLLVARPLNPEGPWRRARVTLSWPLDNIGPSLPNLVTTVAGNLWELRQLTGLRLLDLRLPPAFATAYAGPKFGVTGTRELTGVRSRPLIGTIIKPSVGLNAAETASLVATLCEAGIDFIKDDELQSDGPSCPFDERVRAVMRVVHDHAERTGKKVMLAFNLTGEIEQMRRRHDFVLAQGGSCVMASINSVGLAGMIELGRHTQLPIHAHRNGWGALSRHPALGWEFAAWQKIWRLAGVDHMHVNGIGNKFSESDDSVVASAKATLTPLFEERPCAAMPVFSSGQTAAQALPTYHALGSSDLIFAAGGGILAHPDGPAAGVAELLAAWDDAMFGKAPYSP